MIVKFQKKPRKKRKVISDVFALSRTEIIALAEALRNDRYKIAKYVPNGTNYPRGLIDDFMQIRAFNYLLEDSKAYLRYFSIQFEANTKLEISLGAFGISPNNKVHFPLLLGELGNTFLRLSPPELSKICETKRSGKSALDENFLKLIEVRRAFINKVFEFYRDLNVDYNAVMGWARKSRKSLTRLLAEGAGYNRMEAGTKNQPIELYSSKKLTFKKQEYLKRCERRWGQIFHSNVRDDYSKSKYSRAKLKLFYRTLLNLS